MSSNEQNSTDGNLHSLERGIISREDEALAYLAKVLVEAYLEQKKYVPIKQSVKQ